MVSSTSSQMSLDSQNAAALDYFIQLPVSRDMIAYLAKATSQVIRCDSPPQVLTKTQTATPPSSPGHHDPNMPSLEEYITSIVQRSHVQVPTLMASLVYLARLQAKLPTVAKGMACTLHRIFLAALILAAKNLNDSSPKNKHWARYTTVRGYPNFGFSITEVNLMEKQMLFLLDWDLRIHNEDLYEHLDPFLAPIRQQLVAQERIRQQQAYEQQLQKQREQQQRQQQQQQLYHSYSAYALDTSRRTISRTPSLSPPSSSSTSVSSPDTDSLDDRLESPVDERPQHAFARRDSETNEVVVHIDAHQPKQQHQPMIHRLQSFDEQKPAKKARVGGTPGFLSRLLNHSHATRAVA